MVDFIPCSSKTMAPPVENLSERYLGAEKLNELLNRRLTGISGKWRCDFFPSASLCRQLHEYPFFEIILADGSIAGTNPGPGIKSLHPDGVQVIYPWDLLSVSEMLLDEMNDSKIHGEVSSTATIEGFIEIGENSRILPGVFIEGNCIIGKNCKIGPNCYIRGNTIIGDNCHIGQAVEIKNCIINSCTNIAHLSYAGDSVIGSHVNFGAGTIISNFRHDGKNHFTMVNGSLMDTGRRKFGAIVGDNVHTGIHTSIYPGRKLFSDTSTRPGEIIKHDLQKKLQ